MRKPNNAIHGKRKAPIWTVTPPQNAAMDAAANEDKRHRLALLVLKEECPSLVFIWTETPGQAVRLEALINSNLPKRKTAWLRSCDRLHREAIISQALAGEVDTLLADSLPIHPLELAPLTYAIMYCSQRNYRRKLNTLIEKIISGENGYNIDAITEVIDPDAILKRKD